MVKKKYLIILSMAGMLVSFDQLTKFLMVGNFSFGESYTILSGFFSLTLVKNVGAAFGLFANMAPDARESFFFFVPLATLSIIFVVFYRLSDSQLLSITSLSLIVGGALGNLVDRMRLGYVIDFLDFYWRQVHFPAFNLADISISLGVILLLSGMYFEKHSPDTNEPAHEETI